LGKWKNKLHIFSILIIILVSLLIISGCDKKVNSQNSINSERLVVGVSIVPQETIVKAVAGNLVDIAVMIPPGSSPANYAPSPGELRKLSEAKIYFAIGVPTEQANIIKKIDAITKDIKVVDCVTEVAQVYPDRYFAPGERDPHTWLSPKRVGVMIDVVQRELSLIDPEHKEIYKDNASKYKAKLDKLDNEIRDSLVSLPNKTFIVYHPSFGYFADDYGLDMVAIEEGGKKTTAERIQEIIKLAKEQNIKVIFYQSSITSKQADIIAAEIGGYTVQVDPLARDYISNLQKTAQAFASALKE